MIFNSKNSPDRQYNDTFSAYQFNFGAGAEWKLSDAWKVLTEFSYHSASTNEIDGRDDVIIKGLFGTTADSYAKLDLGIVYYFSKGEPSHICDIYEGIKPNNTVPEKIDYDKIENMIKENLPREIPTVGIAAPELPKKTNWVLIGVNFGFGSSKLKKESYPVLLYTWQILKNNPDMKVEIQGYTDNIGSEKVNLNLSEKRAETVKRFLISKGIEANRLSTKGFGEMNPVADNNSPEGRELNRRIEFKILEQ